MGTQGLAAALQGVNHNLSMSQQNLAVVKMLNVNTRMFTQNCNLSNARSNPSAPLRASKASARAVCQTWSRFFPLRGKCEVAGRKPSRESEEL